MRSTASLLFFAAGLLGLAGCINTDANVFVAPTITSPAAALTTSNPLGVGLTGSFDLGLDLSPRASGPSTVKLVQVNLLDATMKPLVDPTTKMPLAQALPTTAMPALPTTVQPGDDPMISITFADDGTMAGSPLLPTSAKALLCPPAQVVIEAEMQDSLVAGSSKAAYSGAFDVTGCM